MAVSDSETARELFSQVGRVAGVDVRAGENLLDQLLSSCDLKVAASAEKWCEAGYQLRIASPSETAWIGPRLIWHSALPAFTRSLAVVSSRLDRRLDENDGWFHALGTVVAQVPPRHEQFLLSAGTAADPYVRRCAELYGRSTVQLNCPARGQDLVEWLRVKLLRGIQHSSFAIDISPTLPNVEIDSQISEIPLRDRAQFAFADRIVALQVRSKGNVLALLRMALDDSSFPCGSIRVHVDACKPSVGNGLLGRGAVGLHMVGPKTAVTGLSQDSSVVGEYSSRIVPLESIDGGRYLIHWTRRQRGAWSDQSELEYLDELILNLPTRNRSALASLARIVAQKRLLATRGSNRAGASVVSFTSVPLTDWPALRTFRAHRSRWDFEPYGICINRKWLEANGTQAVIYGDGATWSSLPNDTKHLFQPSRSDTRSGRQIDWTFEKEFRCLGDVDLNRVGADDVVVFVPTIEEARHVARLCHWPICVLPMASEGDGPEIG